MLNVKFEQINISLQELSTRTIKQAKMQETPTLELMKCLLDKDSELKICKGDSKFRRKYRPVRNKIYS